MVFTWFYLLNISFVLFLSFGYSVAQNYPLVKDGTVEISFQNYNVSDPEGESIEYTYTILPNSSITIRLIALDPSILHVVLQAHTFFRNVTLSTEPEPAPSTSVTGTNIGLTKFVSTSRVGFWLFNYDGNENVSLLLAAQGYGAQAPIPGGCNMELPVETAPYMLTQYTDAIVTVEFATAALPTSVLAWLNYDSSRKCLPNAVEHVMYRAYLPEREFSPELYFSLLQRMMTVGRIKKSAKAVPFKDGSPSLRRIFAAYPGTGSAYVVVAQTLTDTSVYVPTFSYACDARADEDTCAILTSTFSKIICAKILFLGLFACFAAHRYFLIETALLGFLAGGLILYTALTNLAEDADVLSWSVWGGIGVGLSLIIVWKCFPFPMLSVLLASSLLGYIIAAIIVVPLLDYIDLTSDTNYWIVYCCIIIAVPAVVMSMAEKANILATSVLGAYATIIPIDYYLGSNLRFLLINSIRRATATNFEWAVIDIPFQSNDILLACLWVILAMGGYISQIMLMRNKPPFPAPPRSQRRPRPFSERTPLLRTT